MTPVDASNNPEKVRYFISTSTKIKPKGKPNVTFSLKDTLLIGVENCLK